MNETKPKTKLPSPHWVTAVATLAIAIVAILQLAAAL